MEEHPSIAAEESDAVTFRSTWGTRLLHFVRRWSLSVFAFFLSIGLAGLAFANDVIVMIIALIAGLLFGTFVFALCSRSFLTRLRLTAEHCTFGRRPFHHVISWDDVMLVQVEQSEGTVGDEVKLAIHTRHRHLVIWLAAKDAAACFDAMRELARRAAFAVGHAGFIVPMDGTGGEVVRAGCVLAMRRKARIVGLCATGAGAWGLLILVLGLNHGMSFPADIRAMIFVTSMAVGSISCAGYAYRLHRMANALEAGEIDPFMGDNVAHDDGDVEEEPT